MTVQLVSCFSSPSSAAGAKNTVWKAEHPNPEGSLAGNGLALLIQSDTSPSSCTIADDNGNTWSAGPTLTGGQKLWSFYKLNAATGTRVFTITFDVAPAFISVGMLEAAGLATSGSSTNAAGVTTQTGTITAGSFTPAATGDLVIQFAVDDTATPANGITGFTKGSGWTKVFANRWDGIYAQWRTAPGGAINPSFTVAGSTDNFPSIAFSLPAGASGTTSGGMRIAGRHEFAIAAAVTATSLAFDVPSQGNLLAMSAVTFNTGADSHFSGFTDTGSNTWAESGAAISHGSFVSGVAGQWYAVAATTSGDLVLTGTLNTAQNGGSTVYIYDIVGANTSPYDTFNDNTGSQGVTGNLATNTVTPNTAAGIMLAVVGINRHAIGGAVAPLLFDSPWNASEDGGGNPLHQDNGWGSLKYATNASVSVTWTPINNPDGVLDWAGKVMVFKAPSVAVADDPNPSGGRYAPTRHALNRALRQNTAQDSSNITGQIPSDLSWTPAFRAPRYTTTRALRENPAQDVPAPPPVAPSDLSWTARGVPARYTLNRRLRENEAQDLSNITGQPETDPSWVGRYTPARHALLAQLLHNEAQDSSALGVQAETNVNARLRMLVPQFNLTRALWQNPAVDFAAAPPPPPPAVRSNIIKAGMWGPGNTIFSGVRN